MKLLNSSSAYGLIAILLHWAVALLVIGLIPLGLWMTGLDYYHPWYRQGPDLHRSLGVLVAVLLVARLLWRFLSVQPAPDANARPWERHLAKATHRLLYLLTVLLVVSGYMISTADGRDVSVFGVFELPAVGAGFENQEDLAGEVHYILAMVLIGFVCLHAAAAIKHHVVDGDETLRRMLVPGKDTSTKNE